MELSPAQHARMAVLEYLMRETNGEPLQDIRISIVSLTENGSDWRAIMTTNAHTDRNYGVSYTANPGQTLVETYIKSAEAKYWDNEPSQEALPADYYGVP